MHFQGFNGSELLPLVFMAIMGLALMIYVVLDGYDLGVGILLPFATNDEKDIMVSSIGPFWDANETWLVLGIGVLLVAFPVAHGIVLSAVYLPVVIMLIGLTLRGVSFDFRVKARDKHKNFWNRMFALGSLVASMAQGWMLGSYLTAFSSSWLALAFSLGIALTLPTAYAMLGAGWLIMKTWGDLKLKAVGWGRAVVWPMGLALVGISLATPIVSPGVFDKWFALPQLLGLLPIPLACAVAFFAIVQVLGKPKIVAAGYGWIVFAATVLIFLMAFLGLAYSIYPYVVLDRLTVWQAASATESLIVILIGVAFALPAIIGYTIFMYKVFWGRARALSYGAPVESRGQTTGNA